MKGLIYKINLDDEIGELTYLSFYDELGELTDGICIADEKYKILKTNEIVFCKVLIMDGTEEIKIDDIHEFVDDNENNMNIFYKIDNIKVYSYKKKIQEFIYSDDITQIAIDLYKRNAIKNEK